MSKNDFSIEQELRKKAAVKLPEFFSLSEVKVPDRLVLEQASSSATAKYAASLIKESAIVADLTAGLGVNTYYFSQKAQKVYAVEKDEERAEILRHNLEVAKIENVKVVGQDCEEWLQQYPDLTFDAVFIDPSRRGDGGKKLIKLTDYSPSLAKLLPLLYQRCKRIIVKVSPLLDIDAVVKEFPEITGFQIVEYRKEVKELLLDFSFTAPEQKSPYLKCIILKDNAPSESFSLTIADRINSGIDCLETKSEIFEGGFIYEPSPSLMKASAFHYLMRKYENLRKISSNTHLFYSDAFIPDFPGRCFKILRLIGSSELKKMKGHPYNVISRNHPASADEISRRFRLIPSDSNYLIALRAGKDKAIIETIKIDVTKL